MNYLQVPILNLKITPQNIWSNKTSEVPSQSSFQLTVGCTHHLTVTPPTFFSFSSTHRQTANTHPSLTPVQPYSPLNHFPQVTLNR